VVEAETCCHLVTLNKINIHDCICVLTCDLYSLFVYIEHNGDESHKDYSEYFGLFPVGTSAPVPCAYSSVADTFCFQQLTASFNNTLKKK